MTRRRSLVQVQYGPFSGSRQRTTKSNLIRHMRWLSGVRRASRARQSGIGSCPLNSRRAATPDASATGGLTRRTRPSLAPEPSSWLPKPLPEARTKRSAAAAKTSSHIPLSSLLSDSLGLVGNQRDDAGSVVIRKPCQALTSRLLRLSGNPFISGRSLRLPSSMDRHPVWGCEGDP
jgi:hypothetical protein